jgi:EmrB/QacA subfamily drug resistance transporter
MPPASVEPTSSPGATPGAPVSHPKLVLATTILASSLSFIDGSVVNVGLPAIGQALRGDAAGLQWVINAYLLPLSALLLFGGALGDRYGRRRLLMLGTLTFAVASAACAAAPNLTALTTGRVLQGLGAALLMPNSLAIISDTFEGEARGRAIGSWAAVGAVTAGLGPLVGGWLIDAVGWRMIFVVNLPVAVGALALAWRFVPERGSRGRSPLDPVGALLATAGLALLTYGLVIGAGPAGWTRLAMATLLAGVATLSGFVAWEGRRGRRAMMPLDLFGSRSFVGLNLLTLLLYGALGALVVLLPYAMMRVGGLRAAMAGAGLVPMIAVMAILSPPLGGLAGRIGARSMIGSGSSLVAVGLLMLLRVDVTTSYWTGLLPALCLVGLGLAAAVAPLTTAVLASVEPSATGTASGLNSAVARAGGLVATACLGRVLAADGASLVMACHAAAVIASVVCFAAAACALLIGLGATTR